MLHILRLDPSTAILALLKNPPTYNAIEDRPNPVYLIINTSPNAPAEVVSDVIPDHFTATAELIRRNANDTPSTSPDQPKKTTPTTTPEASLPMKTGDANETSHSNPSTASGGTTTISRCTATTTVSNQKIFCQKKPHAAGRHTSTLPASRTPVTWGNDD